MSFSEQLKKARIAKGLTQQQVAHSLGITNSTYCGYETGKRQPDVPKIQALSKILNISGDSLIETDWVNNDLLMQTARQVAEDNINRAKTEKEKKLLSDYRVLDTHGKLLIETAMTIEVNRITQQLREEVPMLDMMVYTFPAAAGIPLYAEDDFEHIEFPADQVPKGADFGIRISGDSMEPTIHDGDIVWIRKTSELQNGQIGVFMVDDSSVCKRFQKHGKQISLLSDNSSYAPIVIKDFECFGVVGKVLEHR